MALVVALTAPRYLASVDEREIANFFFLDQQTGPEPSEKKYPEVDL